MCVHVRASVCVLRMCEPRPTRASPHTQQVDGRITNMDPNAPTMQVIFVYISVSANLCIHACLLLQGRCGNVDVFVFTHKNRFAYPYNSKCLCAFLHCMHTRLRGRSEGSDCRNREYAVACVCACEDSADHPSGCVTVCYMCKRACVCGMSPRRTWRNVSVPVETLNDFDLQDATLT